MNGSYKMILSIWLGKVRHIWAFPKGSSQVIVLIFCMEADRQKLQIGYVRNALVCSKLSD